ncbi:hypothetical protein Pint_00971 [Pistacia integerrima]|uniref:Uncharacterized protein n=1 Tax=Pistacia integerrima TaxID=434235 RepID=A0ACC0ZPU1_9ROSI|nr:hypothetical protein Pint_00971 [Pistacia integerrima]
MACFRNKKKGFVKPVVKKQQPNVDHITGQAFYLPENCFIRLQHVDVSGRLKFFVQNHQVPNLRHHRRAGFGTESEADDAATTVTLMNDLGPLGDKKKQENEEEAQESADVED